MSIRRRPSLLGALLWIGFGILFLLYNFGFVSDLWSLAGRYWPVLLILLGVGKILEYLFKREAVSIRFGEIIGILILLLIGTTVTRASRIHMGRFIRDLRIDVGDTRISPGQVLGESHTYSEEVTYPLESSIPIRVENAYGTVSVAAGSDREIRINLKKVVYADEARAKTIASEIHLQGGPESLDGSPTPLKPEAEPGKKSGSRYFVFRTNRDSLNPDWQFNTDIEIFVPKNSQVQVVNNDGEIRVAGLNGTLDLSTKNKLLEVRDCTGQFNVSNRYAECQLTNLKGNLNVNTRGKVYIEEITGDVIVKNEYSSMEVLGVDGKVDVTSTEGRLKLERISKPVSINTRGTQLEIADLKDTLKLTASHRDVDISSVASKIDLETRYADLSLRDIQGDIDINSTSDNINADEIKGRFVLKGRGTGLRANGMRGPLDIQTTLKDVVVSDFGDSCRVSNEYAKISLSAQTLGKDVTVKNRNGDVSLYLPESASFLIDATARNGKVESDYAGLVPTRDANTGSLKSKVKSGGPKITLETDYSNIHLYRAQDAEENRPDEAENLSVPSRTPYLAQRARMALRRSLDLRLNRIGARHE